MGKHEGHHNLAERLSEWTAQARILERIATTHPSASQALIDEWVGNIADWLQSEPIKTLHSAVTEPQKSCEPANEPPQVNRVEVYVYNLQGEPQDIREKVYFEQLAASEAAKPKPLFSVADSHKLAEAILAMIQNCGK